MKVKRIDIIMLLLDSEIMLSICSDASIEQWMLLYF